VQGGGHKYYHKLVGGNFRLDTLQAAILDVKLNYLDQWIAQRQEKARRYRSLFQNLNLESIQLPAELYEDAVRGHTYHQFVIRVSDRDRLREYLKQNGIDTEIYYPLPHHLQKCFAYLNYRKGDFPEAERAVEQVLALPIYPELTDDQQEMTVKVIGRFYAR
jgi:dTDP-4-amino-4,6-dideoxygalactose transaminase